MELQKQSDPTSGENKEIWEVIGGFGPWQKTICFILMLHTVSNCWQAFAMTFLAPNMDFWCVEPHSNFSGNQNVTRVPFSERNEQCYVTVYNSSWATENSDGMTSNRTVKCTKWDYDKSYFSDTLVSEWDLVCDREWLLSLSKSVFMIGYCLGALFFGQLSDYIGRFPAIVISYIISAVSAILSIFSTSYTMFVILRLTQAFGRFGLSTTGYVLLMEIIDSQHKSAVGLALPLAYDLGIIILPLFAYFVRNWFWFQVLISVPILPFAVAYKFIPESPRWLLMQGKHSELEKLLKIVAKKNKCDINVGEVLIQLEKVKSETGTKTVFDLFRMPTLRCRMLTMIYLWVVNAFVYYAIALNTNDLAGDPYLNFFISSVSEVPSLALVYAFITKFGRRPSLVGLMMFAAFGCLAIIFVPKDLLWLNTTLAMTVKFCISGSFSLLYVYTAEVFPTVVRNVALGGCSTSARIGSCLSPFVREMGRAAHPSVLNIIYFALALSSGLCGLLLPETKGRTIPDSLQDGELFGKEKCPNAAVPDSKRMRQLDESKQ